jgi:hypothetical protein
MPTRRLNSVDLPTFGRPTIATKLIILIFSVTFLLLLSERGRGEAATDAGIAVVAGAGNLLAAFLPRKTYQVTLLFVGTFDAKALHVFVFAHFSFGELAVFPEYDVEAHSEDSETDE